MFRRIMRSDSFVHTLLRSSSPPTSMSAEDDEEGTDEAISGC